MLADGGLVSLGQLLNEVVGMHQLGRVGQVLQREPRVPRRKILRDRPREKRVAAADKHRLGPQRLERHPADVLIVNRHLARLGLNEPGQQEGDGAGLERIGRDQADLPPRLQPHAESIEQLAALQTIPHVLKLERLRQWREKLRADRLTDLGNLREIRTHPHGRFPSVGKIGMQRHQPRQREPGSAKTGDD